MTSVYNSHLRGPKTRTPSAEHLAVEMSQTVFTTYVCHGWDSNTQPSAYGANALTQCAIAAATVARKHLISAMILFLIIFVFIEN